MPPKKMSKANKQKVKGKRNLADEALDVNEFDGPVFRYIPIGIFAYFSHSRTTVAQRCQIGCELSQAHVRVLHYQIQINALLRRMISCNVTQQSYYPQCDLIRLDQSQSGSS